ncbi:MAG: hypothetical protein MK078_15575 [Crocinitomicaceae bacterium]|nr:hypothetical protein [Crocinitomicaceae bacterium]
MAKIELDDQKYGFSGNNLYSDFDVFTAENKIETEAEVLKSDLLISKTIDKLELNWKIERKGELKNCLLYKDSPILITADSTESIVDKLFILRISANEYVQVLNEEEEILAQGVLAQSFRLNEAFVTINYGENGKDLNGDYLVKLQSQNTWIDQIKENLDVKAVDKEISILRVVYTSENPEFSATFVNTLCDIYVQDYVETKTSAANQALGFINSRIEEIEADLSDSESDLERYKLNNDVVNTYQETETGLREISKLRLDLINLEANEEAIYELEAYIEAGDYYDETAINFGFGDLNLVELVKKLKIHSDEKKDLELKYTAQDQRVKNCQEKIDDIKKYIKEAILRNKQEIKTKRESIENALFALEHQFDHFPTREKEMRRLEREFMINESVYNFLSQKKIEAQIASSAMMSFHRVIQRAQVPQKPVSPNKVLITFVLGFLGIALGLIIIFAKRFMSGKIYTMEDVEKLTSAPIIAAITTQEDVNNAQQAFNNLIGQIELDSSKNQIITISSSMQKEGKTFCSEGLTEAYQKMNYSTCYISLEAKTNSRSMKSLSALIQSPEKVNEFKSETNVYLGFDIEERNITLQLAHKNFVPLLNTLRSRFDRIIIDTPASVIKSEAAFAMKPADLILYIVRCRKSSVQYIDNIELMKMKHEIKNVQVVLNGAHETTNYSGMFTSSKFKFENGKKGIFQKAKTLLNAYSK